MGKIGCMVAIGKDKCKKVSNVLGRVAREDRVSEVWSGSFEFGNSD